jgi:Flp pilus assembly protein TadG
MSSVWTKIRSALRNFSRAREGNVAVTFAIATLPIVGFIGAAVDYSHGNSVKVALQAALDSTALMLSKDAATLSKNELNSKAAAYFASLFNKPEGSNIQISAVYSKAGGSNVVVDGQVDVPTTFMGIVGYDKMTVSGTAMSKWGSSRLRVALALDTTGSMESDGKMTALKSATKSLLTQLKDAASTDGDVYVSIIPFSKDVNVGSGNYNASWIDWTEWDAANGTCSKSGYNSQSSCTAQSVCSISGKSSKNSCESAGTCSISGNNSKNSCEDDGYCSNSGYNTESKCKNKGYRWTSGVWTTGIWSAATWTPKSHSTWKGCIMDRGSVGAPSSQNYDQKIDAPGSSADSRYPAEQFSGCTSEMVGLNYNWTSMNQLVTNLSPSGNTNQPIGLVWAWQSLVGGGPLSVPAKDPDYEYQEIIILLSDGMNTENRWYTSQSAVDKRMYDSSKSGAGTCANIKAAKITVYSIQVNTGKDPTSTVLKNCASTSDKFFIATSASEISGIFSTIGTNLTKLRVAK